MSNTMTDRPTPKVSAEFLGAIEDLAGAALRPALARIFVDCNDLVFSFLRVTTRTDGDKAPTAFESGIPKLRADVEVAREGFTSAPIKVNLSEDYCRTFLTTDRYTLGAGQAIELEGFAVFAWENGGRNGMSFTCDALKPAEGKSGRKGSKGSASSSYSPPVAEGATA